jgi:hypothetical protein
MILAQSHANLTATGSNILTCNRHSMSTGGVVANQRRLVVKGASYIRGLAPDNDNAQEH